MLLLNFFFICFFRDSEGRYRSEWSWDEKSCTGRGNPASSPDVMDTLHAIKKKHGAEGVRNHSGAMSLQYLQCIYNWSLRECPVTFPVAETLTLKDRALIHKHLAWRAFSSFGWTLWTRFDWLFVIALADLLHVGILKH